MIEFPRFNAGDPVLVLIQKDSNYDAEDGVLFLPQGTRLIGTWSAEQPRDHATYAVTIAGIVWHFEVLNATVSSLEEHLHPEIEQERIAAESFALALAQEREMHPNEAQRLYAQAIVELEASGEEAVGKVADARFKRAFLLKEIGVIPEAIAELDRLSRSYESAAITPGYGMIDRDYAELAAQSLNALARAILHDIDPTTEQQKLHQVLQRMQRAIQPIARRYTTKAEVFLTSAEIFFVQGNTKEALAHYNQADTLYQNQLATVGRTDPIALHLDRVRKLLGQPERKRRSTKRPSPTKRKS